jgi:hypothetical protein
MKAATVSRSHGSFSGSFWADSQAIFQSSGEGPLNARDGSLAKKWPASRREPQKELENKPQDIGETSE